MLMEELSLEYIIYDPSYNYDDGEDSDMDCDDGKDINYNQLQYKPDDGITGDDYRGSDGKYDVNWKV